MSATWKPSHIICTHDLHRHDVVLSLESTPAYSGRNGFEVECPVTMEVRSLRFDFEDVLAIARGGFTDSRWLMVSTCRAKDAKAPKKKEIGYQRYDISVCNEFVERGICMEYLCGY
jgi:hypothetical protein